ncbi:hypothetical protein TNCV_4746661 [Trichonephila clavipes]|nr:hypothetical protein TNCV_4746661 [Trichonephila clavipes]
MQAQVQVFRKAQLSRNSSRMTYLTKRPCKSRVQWTLEHRDWAIEKWKSDTVGLIMIYHSSRHVHIRVRCISGYQLLLHVAEAIHRLMVEICFEAYSHGGIRDPYTVV